MNKELFIIGACIAGIAFCVLVLIFGFFDNRRRKSINEFNKKRNGRIRTTVFKPDSAQVIKFPMKGDSDE